MLGEWKCGAVANSCVMNSGMMEERQQAGKEWRQRWLPEFNTKQLQRLESCFANLIFITHIQQKNHDAISHEVRMMNRRFPINYRQFARSQHTKILEFSLHLSSSQFIIGHCFERLFVCDRICFECK